MRATILTCLGIATLAGSSALASSFIITPVPVSGSCGSNCYVAAAGSDSNPGTISQPWQTITKVNASLASGMTVNFNGGDTFSGSLSVNLPATITSYGTGQGIISSGNSAACVTATDVVTTINNISCLGGGNTSNTTDGIFVQNASSAALNDVAITNNTITGYGNNGIIVYGNSTGGTFTNLNIQGNTIHDVTGNGGAGSAGINLGEFSGGTVSIYSGFIQNNLVYNATGKHGLSNWSGSGIFLGNANGVVVQYNVAHDNGQNDDAASGPAGIWTANSTNVTFQFNESYHNLTSGADGGGFDLDGDVTNSVLQYNYSHDNAGEGFLLWTGSFGGGGHTNNVVRFNVSVNDGQDSSLGSGGLVIQGQSSGATDYIYNNTFYSTAAYCGYVSGSGTYHINNNIFYCTHAFGATSIGAWLGNDYFGGVSVTSGDTAASTANPTLASSGTDPTCGSTSGPQPCPSGYALSGSGSPMGAGAGQNLNSLFGLNVGTRDYFGGSVSNTTLPIGAATGT